MQATTLFASFWPGLPQLWWKGDWHALMVAVLFAVAFNFALATTFVWPEMVSPTIRWWIWATLLAFWAAATWIGLRTTMTLGKTSNRSVPEGLFLKAQQEYLKGHWFEAETLLRELIANDQRDADARLMLASLLRHAGRTDEAMVELDALELSEAGGKWVLEIARERQLGLAAVSHTLVESGEGTRNES